MATYQITAPDGNKYRLTGPDNATQQDLINALLSQNPMAGKSTAELESAKSAPMSFGDTARSFGAGLTGGTKSLIDFFGTGTELSKGLGEASDYLQQGLTPERKEEIARRDELQARAAKSGSPFQEAKAFLGGVAEAPLQSLAQAGGSSVPAITASILALPVEAPAALALGVGTIAKLAVGALQGEGERKGSVFDAVKAEYMKQGKSEQEAESLAIQSSEFSRETAFQTGGAMLLGALDAVTGVEPSVGKAMRKVAPTGALTKEAVDAGIRALPEKALKAPTYGKEFLKGIAEEAPLEGAQGAFGQYAENTALQQAGADVTPMQGVFGAGLRDAAVGALFGGVGSPLGMKSARQEFVTDEFLRNAKAEQELNKQKADALRQQEETRAKTEESLGVPKMLALPAPAKEAEQEKDPLQDPIGRITEKELGSKLLGEIKTYRKDNNLPPLKSYSIEDIKDAMSDRSPEEQEGHLNRILAAKTDYQGQTYTPQNILESAVAKNIATETKGWNDFLTRATGKSDLNTMTQPELHTVSNALEELKKAGRSGREEQLVLPEGSNATRFTQDQYNAGITAALLGEKPISMDEALKRVQTQQGIDSDQAAERLLRAAADNDDLTIEKGTGFQAVSPGGTVLGTYASEAEAKRNHRRADILPVETELVAPRVEESTEKVAQLPKGYEIKTKTVAGESTPVAYVLKVDGSEKYESQTFAREEDAKEHLELLTRKRKAKAAAEDAAVEEIRKRLERERDKIAQMEADGKAGTDDHRKAVNKYQALNVVESENIIKHSEAAEAALQPLKIVPLGKKTSKVEKHTVTKNGKEIGTFTGDKGKTGRTKAEEHILSQASEEELQTIADRGGVFGKRAEVELDTRKRPGVRGGTTAGLEAAGVHTAKVEAQLKELKAKLLPMLKKFGLEKVGLNVVRAIENDADGAWGKADKLIRIALQATNPIKTMRHEALHALKELGFFTDAQWEALKRQAEKTWVDKYLKNVRYNETMSRYDAYANGIRDENGNILMAPLSREDILEEAIADAFGDFEAAGKAPAGMLDALFKRLQQFFSSLRQALTGAGFESADDIFGKIERGELKAGKEEVGAETKMSLKEPSQDNAWKADEQTIKDADKFEEENGIRPYVSEGFLDLPTEGTKYSLQKFDPEKHLSFDASLGLPINQNGLVTVYYHTTKEKAVEIGNKKIIPSDGRNRIYLTNESNGADVLRNRGNFDQELDGSTVLVYVHPDMLQVDAVQEGTGRRDFFIPLAQGDFFNKKMKLQSIQKSRTSPITEVFSYNEHEGKITSAVKAYKDATPAERKKLVSAARKILKQEHNVGSLLSENGKLEKTRVGDYNLDWEGNSVASMGLGLASAQQISEKVSTCPRSAICEGLCLGETSGGNFLFGGAATEDVGDIQKSSFRAAARMMQYLKTEALVVHPEEFATVLQAEIDSLAKWCASEEQIKVDKETKKRYKVEKEIYQPAVRLNVTSDFKPGMFRAIIEANPDTMFYDYTKLGSESIAPNHHLTYSSTGFGQIVKGEKVFFKDKLGEYDHNWATMRSRLNDGKNVAMAFSSKSGLPSFLVDEETGQQYRVWNGDDYDARFLDPKQPDGKGMIIGLKNKAGNLSEKTATEKTGGFFVQYDPKTDGDTVVVPNQEQFRGKRVKNRVIEIKPEEKFSLKTYFPTAEEAENAAYQKAPPLTPEFKRFFGASKVKEEGRAQPMFHASPNEFDTFRENKPIFISPTAKEAEYFGKRHRTPEKMDVNIYPLWVRAETPFDFENPNHIRQLGAVLALDQDMIDSIKEGHWETIESQDVQDALQDAGFDSFFVKEYKTKNLAVFNANQVKSITGNIGEFGENKNIKYSLPVIPAAAAARRDETTQAREHKGFIERITDAFKPESLADLRASFIHRYNQLGVYDRMLAEKMGGQVLLADMSAEAAANMSDLSASVTYAAFGIGNRKGGIPVYKNGMTTIDNSVRGPLEILSPLAKFNDPKAYQDYQYWAGVKRGMRYEADGKEKNFDKGDIALAEQVRQAYLAKGVDFIAIQKEMNTFNDGLVDYMKATGVLAPERAAEFKKHMDYIPFYRQLNGEDTVGPKIFNSISGVKPPKKLKGSEAPLTDYLESIVQNTQAAINAGMKNMAAQRAINVAMQLGPISGAQRLSTVSSAPDTVQVLESGKQVSYRVADQLFINAVKSLNMAEIPFLGLFSAPSNLLRNLVTKDPGFMLANLARDSLSAWVTSGSNMTPIIGTAANFAKALGGKHPSLHALYNAGILGGYEFSSGVIKSGEVLEKDLNKKYGSAGAAAPLKVFKGVWDALEHGTEASDAATRMAVYERVLEETGNETEALYRALEVMNFNRKGSSPVVRILTAAIPFLNARVQGLDVFYRTAFGKNVMSNPKEMQKAFFVRGATLMALSAAYFLAVSDDDEWKKQEQETKDNYWILPGVGKFPTPFEVGFLFKTVPERIMAYTMKDDTGQDFMQSMQRGLLNTFAFNPIPQIAKPVIEYNADYNFFTGRPIVGQGMQGVEAPYQVGPNTTKTAEALGKALGMSPLKLDQLISSYTGTMGMYAMTAIDAVLDTQSDSPHASKRFEQLPIVKRFAVDPEARGNITQYYELKKAVDAAVQTENLLLKAGKAEEFADFMEKNAGLLATKEYVSNVEKSMKQMREMRKMVQGAEMSADEKRDTLTAIGQAENNMNANIQTIKKMVSEF